MFVITVVFEVHPEREADFSEAVRAQADNSLKLEPDCHLFDVCQDPDRTNRFFLYELYKDEAAFETHLQSAHFHDFDRKVADMVISKSVEGWRKL